jgi:hypothetical protein
MNKRTCFQDIRKIILTQYLDRYYLTLYFCYILYLSVDFYRQPIGPALSSLFSCYVSVRLSDANLHSGIVNLHLPDARFHLSNTTGHSFIVNLHSAVSLCHPVRINFYVFTTTGYSFDGNPHLAGYNCHSFRFR